MKPYYVDDYATIYHGDCRAVVKELLDNGEVFDLTLTDPPYDINHVGGSNFQSAQKFYAGLEWLTDFNLNDFKGVLGTLSRQLVAFHSRDLIEAYSAFISATFKSYDLHVWYKYNAVPFTHNTWKSDLEYIALGWDDTNHTASISQELKSKCYMSALETNKNHPTQKPLALMAKYIRVLAHGTIIDPFMGGGSTLVAAKQMGHKCVGIELTEQYCEVAAERLMQCQLELFDKEQVPEQLTLELV